MRTHLRETFILWVAIVSVCFHLAVPVCAGAAWLRTPQLAPRPPQVGQHAWDLEQQRMEAVWDVVHIYRHSLALPGALEAMEGRLSTTSDALRALGAQATAASIEDAQLVAITVLRHRALEEMCLRLAHDKEGLRHAAAADSLAEQLRLLLEPMPATPTTAQALAAGVPVSRAQWERLHPALYTLWRQFLFAPEGNSNGNFEFLLFHVLAGRDGRVFDDVAARAASNPAIASLQELIQLNRQGRVGLFSADDAARRLLLGVRQLARENRIGSDAVQVGDRLSWMDIDASTPYPSAIATLDTLQSALDNATFHLSWRKRPSVIFDIASALAFWLRRACSGVPTLTPRNLSPDSRSPAGGD